MKIRSKRLISFAAALALWLSSFSGLTAFAEGGTLSYEIDEQGNTVYYIEDLADLGAYKENPGSYPYVKLSNDINISSLCSGDNGGNPITWIPIGSDEYSSFEGTFDGNGHTISGFSMDTAGTGAALAGLFGYNKGIIKNLTVSGTVTGDRSYGDCGTGGICAINRGGTIESCVNEVTVTGVERVGGICGYNDAGQSGNPDAVNGIINCVNKAAVSGENNIGGVCGYNNNGATVNKCRNDGAVTAVFSGGGAQSLGGICGYNEGNVRNSFNTATLGNTGESGEFIYGLGGICGNHNGGNISYCFNVGGFAALEGVGGICGSNNATIENTYYLKEAGDSFYGIAGSDLVEQTTPLTADEFASGIVAHAFEGAPLTEPGAEPAPGDIEFWGQTVNRDAYPMITDNESKRVYKVTFYAGENGSTEADAAYANAGGKVNLPDDPDVGSGYEFAGWSTSKTGTLTNNFTSATPITGDTDVYAIREEKYGADYARSITITDYDSAQGTPSSYNLAQYVQFAGGTRSESNFTYTIMQGKSGNMQNADIRDDSLIIPTGVPAGIYTFLIKASVVPGSNISLYEVSFGTSDVYLMITFEIAGTTSAPMQAEKPQNIAIDYIDETLINAPETEGGFERGRAYKIIYTDSNDIEVMRSYVYSGSPIAIAEDWFGRTISIVCVGTGGYIDSEALELSINRPNAPTTVAAEAETAEGTGGKITGVDTNMQYKRYDEASWHDCEGNEVTGLAAGTYLVRYKAVENVKFASQTAQTVVSAYAAPETRVDAPIAEINYANESLKITNHVTGAEYTVGGNTITLNDSNEWPIPAIAAAPGGSYGLTIVRISHDDASSDSEPVNITIPARPAVPSGLLAVDETEAGKSDGKITGTNNTMEYRKSVEEEWTECPEADMTGLAPGTYYIRYKSTSEAFAGLAAELIVNAGAEPEATDKPVQTAAPTDKPVQTAAPTDKPVQTAAPTDKPVQTATPTEKPAQTAAPTEKPVQTAAPTEKPVQTAAPTEKPMQTATPTEKPAQTAAPTEKPVQTATPTDKPVQTATPTEKPVQTATPTDKPVQTAAPTDKPVQTTAPTAAPTVAPTQKPFEWNIAKTSSTITVKGPAEGFEYVISKDGKDLSDPKSSPDGKDIVFSGLKSNTTYVVKARSVSDPTVEYTTEVTTNTSGGGGGGGSSSVKKTPTPKPEETSKPDVTPTPEPVKTPEPSKMPAEQNPEDKPFTDISNEDWFAEDVLWANQNGIMTGILQTEFVPDMPLTRGMLAAILGRMENVESRNGKTPFTDVDENMYYAPYIAWAYENDILHGMDDHSYCPDENVTREQMAVAIKNYAEYKGRSVELAELDYTDSDRISDWAKESVAYCRAAGYMFGRLDGSFDPGAGLTRAECAAVIRRLY